MPRRGVLRAAWITFWGTIGAAAITGTVTLLTTQWKAVPQESEPDHQCYIKFYRPDIESPKKTGSK